MFNCDAVNCRQSFGNIQSIIYWLMQFASRKKKRWICLKPQYDFIAYRVHCTFSHWIGIVKKGEMEGIFLLHSLQLFVFFCVDLNAFQCLFRIFVCASIGGGEYSIAHNEWKLRKEIHRREHKNRMLLFDHFRNVMKTLCDVIHCVSPAAMELTL